MELTARELLKRFGIKLRDMPEAGCCPDPSLKSVDQTPWMTLAARNLAIAENMGMNILTLCNGCFETLKTVNHYLKNDGSLKEEVNKRLKTVGKEYKGEVQVKHLVEVLSNEIGFEKLKGAVTRSLKGFRVAAHYGCHLLRPSSILKVDDPVRPVLLDELIKLTGATPVSYYKSNLCCGAGVSGVDSDTGKNLVKYKLQRIENVGADFMTVVCPFCMLQYDVTQMLVKKSTGERFNVPVLYYPEMMLLAMGADPEELALEMHRVSTEPLVKRIIGG